MTQVARAVEKSETQGFMKVLVDAASRQILEAPRSWVLAVSGHSLHPGRHVRQGALYRPAARDAHHPTVSELIATMPGERKPL
jgi:pyruvate/2-oxoglutarate dehydrogenase complex dihydrolipoamide dehydrogenase (E3) component